MANTMQGNWADAAHGLGWYPSNASDQEPHRGSPSWLYYSDCQELEMYEFLPFFVY